MIPQGPVCENIELLGMLLKKLSFLAVIQICLEETQPSCFNHIIIIISMYENQNHTLSNWNQPVLAPQQLHSYAEAMHVTEALLDLCVELANGTVSQISRPKTKLTDML